MKGVTEMQYESFKVEHREYGQVTWYVVDKTETTLTLIGAPTLERVAFYNPIGHEEARYIRTDFSSSRKSNEPGTLYEVQNATSTSEQDNENARRYSDIVEYGSNQWVVSDLRKRLNESYFEGFPEAFRKQILPKKHDMVLSRTPVNKYTKGKTLGQYTSNKDFVYDEYCGNSRLTKCMVEDYIYLPSFEDREMLELFVNSCNEFGQSMNMWLIDAAYETSVPYLVKCVAVSVSAEGKIRVNYGDNNARYPLHVCPMCTIAIQGKEQKKETLQWTDIDEERVERAKKVHVFSVNKETKSAECIGSKGERYNTTLNSCQCGDYIRRQAVCKHMIRLAMELGLLNSHGRTDEEQQAMDISEAKEKLAYWYGCYYLLNERVVSDAEYDALKEKVKKEYGIFI